MPASTPTPTSRWSSAPHHDEALINYLLFCVEGSNIEHPSKCRCPTHPSSLLTSTNTFQTFINHLINDDHVQIEIYPRSPPCCTWFYLLPLLTHRMWLWCGCCATSSLCSMKTNTAHKHLYLRSPLLTESTSHFLISCLWLCRPLLHISLWSSISPVARFSISCSFLLVGHSSDDSLPTNKLPWGF